MSLRVLALLTFALFSPGCVPVTEPVGDIDKAEPDESLVGSWAVDLKDKKDKKDKSVEITIPPKVKGNPKGLMLFNPGEIDNKADAKVQPTWFFVAKVGKEKYVNFCLGRGTAGTDEFRPESPPFDKEGEYAKWANSSNRRYMVWHCTTTEDGLALKLGDDQAFEKLMKAEKIAQVPNEIFFKTPPGWLAKYLEKNGPESLYGKSVLVLKKKK